MAQGSIITRVYTSDAYLPLRDVPVVYTQIAENGTTELLSIQMTDGSGLTKPFYIDTPEVDQSLTSGNPLRPYATINIGVSYPGYNAVSAEGVQIFPGIQTIQGFQLRPVSSTEHGASDTIFENTQNL